MGVCVPYLLDDEIMNDQNGVCGTYPFLRLHHDAECSYPICSLFDVLTNIFTAHLPPFSPA